MAINIETLSYLLAIVSACATLAGIGFAIYGWYNLNHAERIVEKKLQGVVSKLQEEIREMNIRTQEATQKIIAGYGLMAQNKFEEAVSLFEKAIQVDPQAFNGYTALGYALLQLGKHDQALEAFFRAKELFPYRHEPYNDLARVYAIKGEFELATKYIAATIERHPDARTDIEADPVFDPLREALPEAYRDAIKKDRR